MSITWNESLSTGVAAVDNQHKELIRQLNALHGAMSRGEGREEITKILDFLGDYVVRHFADEEREMARLACPAAAENKRAHAQFIAMFKDLRGRHEATGASTTLLLKINEALSAWLVEHIKKIDTQLTKCLAHA